MNRVQAFRASLATLLVPVFGHPRVPELPQIPASVLRYDEERRPGRKWRGPRRTPKVPRVGGIAHPPTARLRKCGAWGRR